MMPYSKEDMMISGFNNLDTDNCILNDKRIDLWQFSLTDSLDSASRILNQEEQERANRFYFKHHQRRFATARTTLRIILSRYLNSTPARLEFHTNQYGKPQLEHGSKIQFNLSHSGDLALLAIGKNFPLGVDIEEFSTRPYDSIAKNMFSAQEFENFSKVPQALKAAVFFHIWSQKEAFIKANGLGLSYPTQDFSVPTSIPTRQLVDDALHNTTWQLRSFMPKVAFSGALCHHPTIREIRYGKVKIQSNNNSLQFEG